MSGCHAHAGKAVGARLTGLLGRSRFPVGFGFEAGHPTGTAGFGLPFQLRNPFLQPFDAGLLPDDDANEHIPVGSGEVDFPFHTRYVT